MESVTITCRRRSNTRPGGADVFIQEVEVDDKIKYCSGVQFHPHSFSLCCKRLSKGI